MLEGALFSTRQVEYLEAMGFTVFTRPEIAALPSQPKSQPREPAAHVSPQVSVPAPKPAPALKPAPTQTPAPPPVAAAAPAVTRALPPSSQLEKDLLAATGQSRRNEARAVLDKLGVNSALLRGDADAKRELWQRLRSLRPRKR